MKLLSKKATAAKLGFHPEHLMRMVRTGQFPKPIKTSASANSAVRFVQEEVDAWLSARMAAR